MQGNMEPDHGNVAMPDPRANAKRKLKQLRGKRKAVVPKTDSRPRSAGIPIPPTPPAREVNPLNLTFLFEKRLKYSDVKDEGRIVVPKSFAEKYMPRLQAKEGFYIFMDDMTEVRVWRFRYRFWPNNSSRVYVLENTAEFVRTRVLQIGDFLMIYKDNETQTFVVGVRRAVPADGPDEEDDVPDFAPPPPPALALPNNAMIWPAPHFPHFEEMQIQVGAWPAAAAAVDHAYQFFPPVGGSTSGYSDGLEGFPMDLLDMDIDFSDLPEF